MVSKITVAKRIGGQHLGQNLNNEIILIGEIKKVSSSGKGIELLTTDNVTVNVSLPEPIDGIAEGLIEVYGTALSKSTVSCKKYIIFQPEMTENFESTTYNAFLSILHVIGDKKWKVNSDESPY